MSDLHIALVAEGKTDYVIIESALKAILPSPFVLTLLQPEPTRPHFEGGWCGVFKWCSEFRQSNYSTFEEDPTLELYDLFIIHLDADVAEKSYCDCSDAVALAAAILPSLPCSQPCPPPSDTVTKIETMLLAWLGIQQLGSKTVFCIPSKASEAWLTAAMLPHNHNLLTNIECNLSLETSLAQLPKAQKVRKSVAAYRPHASTITAQWDKVCCLCLQATIFHQHISSRI
jgi:hypothetical protein